jgi:hypothetical protein
VVSESYSCTDSKLEEVVDFVKRRTHFPQSGPLRVGSVAAFIMTPTGEELSSLALVLKPKKSI